jgi:hypothetical protein
MKTVTLATLLWQHISSKEISQSIVHQIIPPHCRDEVTYSALDEALAQTKKLYAQRDELNELLPNNAENHERQFDEAVIKIAAQFLESIEATP